MRFKDYLDECLQDPEFKKEWEDSAPDRLLAGALIERRHELGLSQETLSQITGIHQADLSRLENESSNITIKTLKRVAEGLNCNIKIELIPREDFIGV